METSSNMNQNEPPQRHVRMKRGKPRKVDLPTLVKDQVELKHTSANDSEFNRIQLPAQAEKTIREYEQEQATRPTEIARPQINDVIQAVKGDNPGRLGIIGRIDIDCYQCYAVTKGGLREYFSVLPDEFAIIGRAKKGAKFPEQLPSSIETPNINADTSPFGGNT